jgi:hypothetical protein
MKNFLLSLLLITIAQSLAYLQLQSQFFWNWAKSHTISMAMLGFPISILLIYFTKYCALSFGGQVWPGRLIGFAVGAIIFALLSHYIMKEEFTPQTLVCLGLAILILLIQIIWK